MKKRGLYAIVAVVVVIVVIVAVATVLLYKPTTVTPTPTAPTLVSVTPSTQLTTVGSTVQFVASVTGNVTTVSWSFGDGATAIGLSVNHTYTEPGTYLVFVNASGPSGYANNLKTLIPISISPESINPLIASEITQPVLTLNTTLNPNAPIYNVNKTAEFLESYLQPPTATNWTIGYYVMNFGDGSPVIITPVYYNFSSGVFEPNLLNHIFTKSGFYVVNLTIITYNESLFSSSIVTNNTTSIQYLPLNEYNQVLSSNQHFEVSYIRTIFVATPQQSVGILKTPVSSVSSQNINVAEVVAGGPYSFDPAIDYESAGWEIIVNVYETLITYNGSQVSESSLIPMVATNVPSISNGEISENGLNYTFYIRPNLKFSNGDSLNVFDVYASIVRTLLFMQGSPGTAGWIIAQDLLPGGGWANGLFTNGTALYDNITRAITYDNATQSITFHLSHPDPAFLDYVADPLGGAIMDWNWLVQNGAGITFTPAGFLAYTSYSDESNYNNYIRYHAIGSGPYEISTYLAGQSIILKPNPYYSPIPNVPGYNHKANDTIYIQWLKDPETAILMSESGQADIITGWPDYYYPTLKTLESQGKINIYTFPSYAISGFVFNFNVNTTGLASSFGSNYHIPQYYFTNLYIRRAFADAFNYTDYINELVGNQVYGANFSFNYLGAIPYGMPGYISPNQFKNHGVFVPQYNLTLAKDYLIESGEYNVSINIPAIVVEGDPTDYAAISMWGEALHSIDPNIEITPVYVTFSMWLGYQVPNQNPMPIYILSWLPDYPYPSDYMMGLYFYGGTYASGSGFNSTILANIGEKNQSLQINLMNQYILNGMSTPNATLAINYFDQAEMIAVNLTAYVYTAQGNSFWVYSTTLKGESYEQNPLYGGSGITIYIYLSK